ncbi:MAG TPA: peptidoglycan editing factor PgeF [Gammaproteobacteria bacterium]|nr:peptidoglycan editing factor PgeF [Gammaproteobacteria bacterium]
MTDQAESRLPSRWIYPDWPAPISIHAGTTTRAGGWSRSPYASFNLGAHVGDSVEAVRANRNCLVNRLSLPKEPYWLEQHHGNRVIDPSDPNTGRQADGACTAVAGVVCAILTADCLPLLLCNRAGSRVAALHCGWRGLAEGIISSGLKQMGCLSEDIVAWLGPAISAPVYEVGEEVYAAFAACDPSLTTAFTPTRPGHWLLDLYASTRSILKSQGVHAIYGGHHCTYREPTLFFSHRRDGGITGRMASLIWIATEVSASFCEQSDL